MDNGRILYAKICSCALTEIDLDIVIKQYDYDEIIVTSAMVSQKDYLPEEYKNVIRRYYHNKTALKGIKNDPVAEYLYRKDKEKLNAIFGMSCQSALNSDVLFIDDTFVVLDYETRKKSEIEKILNKLQEKGIDDKSLVKALEKASDIDKTLLKAKYPYSWGCYTTAYARAALQEGIDLAGDKMVYCDTDSIKTLGPVDIEKINESRRNLAKRFGGVEKDRNGISHYIGIFEYEMTYTNFVSTGAKRYAYIEGSCPLSESCTTWPRCAMGITVSGVQSKKINEETGLPFAVEELGSLENFREDFTWYKAGGVLAVYNDFDNFDYTDPETGRSVHIGKNVALCPSTYKMTYEKNYIHF